MPCSVLADPGGDLLGDHRLDQVVIGAHVEAALEILGFAEGRAD